MLPTRSIGHSMGSQTVWSAFNHPSRIPSLSELPLGTPHTDGRSHAPPRAATDPHEQRTPQPRGPWCERGAKERRAAANGRPGGSWESEAPTPHPTRGVCAQAQTAERRQGAERRWERLRTAVDAPGLWGDGESESRWEDRGGNREAEPGLVIWRRKKVKGAGPGHSMVSQGLGRGPWA